MRTLGFVLLLSAGLGSLPLSAKQPSNVLIIYDEEFTAGKEHLANALSSTSDTPPAFMSFDQAMTAKHPQTKFDKIIVLAHGAPGRVIRPSQAEAEPQFVDSSFVLPFVKNKTEIIFHNCLIFESKESSRDFLDPLVKRSKVAALRVHGSADFVGSPDMMPQNKDNLRGGLEYLKKLNIAAAEYLEAHVEIQTLGEGASKLDRQRLQARASTLNELLAEDAAAQARIENSSFDENLDLLLGKIQSMLFYLHAYTNSGDSKFKAAVMSLGPQSENFRAKRDFKGLAGALRSMNLPRSVSDSALMNKCAYRLKSFELSPLSQTYREISVPAGKSADSILGSGFEGFDTVAPQGH